MLELKLPPPVVWWSCIGVRNCNSIHHHWNIVMRSNCRFHTQQQRQQQQRRRGTSWIPLLRQWSQTAAPPYKYIYQQRTSYNTVSNTGLAPLSCVSMPKPMRRSGSYHHPHCDTYSRHFFSTTTTTTTTSQIPSATNGDGGDMEDRLREHHPHHDSSLDLTALAAAATTNTSTTTNPDFTATIIAPSPLIRPKATSRIEVDHDDYCSTTEKVDPILTNDPDDYAAVAANAVGGTHGNLDNDLDDSDHDHQHDEDAMMYASAPTTNRIEYDDHDNDRRIRPATANMAAISAIAHGKYSMPPYHQNHQNQNHDDDTLSTTASKRSSSPHAPRKKYNIYELDTETIRGIEHVDDLNDIVTQVEQMELLDRKDVYPLIIPLSRITSRKHYGENGAKLTERLLLTCLGRLPINIFDRYTKSATFVESGMPNRFSMVLSTRDWIPTDANHNNNSGGGAGDDDDEDDFPNDRRDNRIPPANATAAGGFGGTAPIRIQSKLSYPTEGLFNRAIIAWGNLANSAGLHRAESLFQLQVEEYVRELEFVRYHQLKQKKQKNPPKFNTHRDSYDNNDNTHFNNDDDNVNNTMPFMGMNPELQLPPEPFAAPPGRKAYKSLIRAWVVSGEKNSAAKAYELLREMEHLSGVQELLQQPRDTSLRPLPPIPPIEMPDLGVYNLVLSIYAKSFALHQPLILDRVKKIMYRVQDLKEATKSDEYRLDAYSYIAILQTYSRHIHQCTTLEYKYLDELYTIIRGIHDEIARRKSLPPTEHHEKWEFYLKRRLDQNHPPKPRKKDTVIFFPMSLSWAYGVVVDALLKSQPLYRTIFLADEILVAMTGRRNRVNTLPTSHDNDDDSGGGGGVGIHNLRDTRDDGENVSTMPSIHIPYEICTQLWPQHDTLMRLVVAWSQSRLPQAKERIEHVVQLVVADAHFPRLYFLHEKMESWSNSNWHFSPYVVENLLHRGLENSTHVHNKPTGQTFAIAFKAWMRADHRDGAHRAELLLQHLLYLYEVNEDSWYKPREVHLRYIITNWLNRCKSGQRYDGISGKDLYPAEHIEKLTFWFRDRPWFRPFAENVFSMAIRAWSMQQMPASTSGDVSNDIVLSSNLYHNMDNNMDNHTNDNVDDNAEQRNASLLQPNPVEHAVKLLDSFATSFVPDGELIPPYPCNWVLETCAQVQPTLERRLEAYEAGIQTFQKCRQNSRSYTLTVQVIRNQVQELNDSHRAVIEDLFRKCCLTGLLSQDMVLQVVATATTPEPLQRLFGLSYQLAQLIIQSHQQDPKAFAREDRIPQALLIQNLPQEWSIKATKPTNKKTSPTSALW
jgi:hypothetical protein